MGVVNRTHRSSRPLLKLIAAVGAVAVLAFVGSPGCGSEEGNSGASERPGDDSNIAAGASQAVGGLDLDLSPMEGAAASGAASKAKPAGGGNTPPGSTAGPSGSTPSGTQAAAGSTGAPSATPPAGPASSNMEGGIEELRKGVEKIVANAVAKASKGSKGKANGKNCAVAVMAVDVETGQVLVRRQADLPLIPASNLKLMTVAAALGGLGPDGEFVTNFEALGEIRDGVLEGDLVVRAGGDPLYQAEGSGSIDPWLGPLAEDLKKAGIERIRGALVLDEGTWVQPGPGPQWPSASDFWQSYCALAAGLTVNAGSFRATVTPLPKNGRVDVDLQPRHSGLKRRGSVKLGKKNAVNVGANTAGVTVKGTIPSSSGPLISEFSAPDPVELFGHAFVGGLKDRGIPVDGGFLRTRNVVKTGPVVHSIRTPIVSVFQPILQESHNAIADQLFFALGAQTEGAGTRLAASRAVKAALGKIGVLDDGLVQVDGSGLSKANRTSATQLVALVGAVMKTGGRTASTFLDALPVAGRSGTLSQRMRGTAAEGQVRAKSGWVSGASSLSGVAKTLNGRTIVFSILVGYPRLGGLNRTVWKPMHDDICVLLVEWSPEMAR